MTLLPRVVLVTRPTELDELLRHHGTRGQAEFFLRSRGRDLAAVQQAHDDQVTATRTVLGMIPREWRQARVERGDLDRFAFAPEDLVVVVGRDGLVANVAKYLDGQPVIGVVARAEEGFGVLTAHPAAAVGDLLAAAVGPTPPLQRRTMVQAVTDDGQRLAALNELYVGDPGHQSARWRLRTPDGQTERQSSSGLLAGTGTGATGWLRSVWTDRDCRLPLPDPTDSRLAWCVRETWPSPTTGATLTDGLIAPGEVLTIEVESDRLVVFGDGIEQDALMLTWGMRVTVGVADRTLQLVTGGND
ncbi:NAD(+)/NADH kinase [soil metagenome]